MKVKDCIYSLLFAVLLAGPLQAADLVPTRLLGLDLARDIATAAVEACRKDGFQIAVVVSDRSGDPVVVMRDVFVSKYMVQIAHNKTNAVVMSGIPSGQFRASRGDIRPELNHVRGILMMVGGVPVEVAGSRIGAIGVSGAPGGEKDEVCARAALEKLVDRIEFVE